MKEINSWMLRNILPFWFRDALNLKWVHEIDRPLAVIGSRNILCTLKPCREEACPPPATRECRKAEKNKYGKATWHQCLLSSRSLFLLPGPLLPLYTKVHVHQQLGRFQTLYQQMFDHIGDNIKLTACRKKNTWSLNKQTSNKTIWGERRSQVPEDMESYSRRVDTTDDL